MSAAPPLHLLTLRADGRLLRTVQGGRRLTRRFTAADLDRIALRLAVHGGALMADRAAGGSADRRGGATAGGGRAGKGNRSSEVVLAIHAGTDTQPSGDAAA